MQTPGLAQDSASAEPDPGGSLNSEWGPEEPATQALLAVLCPVVTGAVPRRGRVSALVGGVNQLPGPCLVAQWYLSVSRAKEGVPLSLVLKLARGTVQGDPCLWFGPFGPGWV